MILMRKLAILSTFLLVIFFQTPADASLARIRKKPAPAPSEKTAKRTTRASPGDTCLGSSDCDGDNYCRDYDFSVGSFGDSGADVCVSCTDSLYPCSYMNSVDGCSECPTSGTDSGDDAFSVTGSSFADYLSFTLGSDYSSLQGSSQTCDTLVFACVSTDGCNVYTGSCNVVVKKTDMWCDDYCFGASDDDCCEINPGPVAGIAIGAILFLVFAIVGCCACCKCFCFGKKKKWLSCKHRPCPSKESFITKVFVYMSSYMDFDAFWMY